MKKVLYFRNLFRKHFMWLFLLTAFAFGNNLANAQTTVTIGTGTSSGSYLPVNSYYNYSYSQQIVLQSEIGISGTIQKIRFYMVGGIDLTNSNNWTIYLGHTTKTSFSSTTDWVALANLTQVYTGTIAATPTAGWYEITFSTPFNYNNTDNLVVAVDENAANYNTSTSYARIWTPTLTNRAIYYSNDYTNPDPASPPTGTRTSTINQMQFDILQLPCTGTPAPGNTIASANPVCVGANFNLSLQNQTVESGITYQWQSSPDNLTWTNIGTGLSTLTASTSTNTYYQCVVTCTNSAETATSTSVLVNTKALSTIPIVEGFSATMPECWSSQFISPQTGTKLSFITSGYSPTTSPQEGTHFVSYSSANSTNGGAGSEELLKTPAMNTTGVSSIDIEFYLRNQNNTSYNSGAYLNEGVQIQFSTDGNTWTNAGSLYPRHDGTLAAGTAAWNKKILTLPAAAANQPLLYVALKFHSEYGNNIFVDNVSLIPTPSCPIPSVLSASNITATSATLNWTENGSAVNWNIKASLTPINPAIDPSLFDLSTSNNPYPTPAVLTPNTTYYWYVQADCGGGDLSAWSVQNTFKTLCGVNTPPFSEDFSVFPPECWTRFAGTLADPTVVGTSTAWLVDGFANVGTTGAAKLNIYGTSRKEWLVSPSIDLGDGSTPYVLSFDLALTAFGSTSPAATSGTDDKFAVVISTDNGATWSSANTLRLWDNAGSTYVYNNIATAGGNIVIDLSTYTGIVKIGFYGESTVSNADNDLSIDNFAVREMSDENDIVTFSLAEQTGPATIDATAYTVDIEVAMGTVLTALTPAITISDYATINPASGTAQDFSAPFAYTVTSESGTAQIWTVTVSSATTQSSEKDILTFTLPQQTAPATIGANTIDILVGWQTSLSSLTPTITISDLAAISPLSNVAQNFSTPVTYTVTAEDGTTKDYLVTVTQETAPLGANCSNPFVVDIPADLTYQDLSQTNCGLGNVYDSASINYDNGEDAIYRLDVTSNTVVKITMSTSTAWTGLFLFDACPDTGNIITSVTNSGSANRVVTQALTAGTYYIMIDTYASPDCIPDYNLTIEQVCPAPSAIQTVNLTATSTDLQWTAGGFETAWNIKVNEATAIADPSTTDGDIIANNPVSPTPEYSIVSGLTASTNYYVYVQANCGSTWTQFMFTTPAACPVPTGLSASAITTNSATLTWNELGTSGWVIEISSTPLTDPETQTGDIANNVNVSGTVGTYNVTGLDANTTYYWYVKSACLSAWSVQGTFKTNEMFYPLPISEDFEAGLGKVTFINGTQTNYWMNGTLASQTGNAMFVTNNGTDNQYTLNSTSVSYAYIPVDFNGATDVLLNFDWICNGEGTTTLFDYLRVYLVPESTTLIAGTLPTSTYQIATYNLQTTLQNASITLSAAQITQNNMKLVFAWRNDGTGGSQPPASVDNISLTEITCSAPTALTSSAITTNSATISWTAPASAPANGYEYYVATSATPVPNAATTATGTTAAGVTTADLSSLNASTTYYFWVRSNCGSDDYSAWSSSITFTTVCGPVTSFTEGFESTTGSIFPNCWAKVGTTGGAYPQASTGISGARNLYIYSGATVKMPPVSNAGADTHQLRFKQRANYTVGETIYVGYLTDPNDAATFVSVTSFVANSLTASEKILDLGSAPGTNEVLAFQAGTLGNSVLIDDVNWEPKPACPTPTELATSSTTSTSATLNWTENGTAVAWNIVASTAPFDPTSSTGDFGVVVATNPFTTPAILTPGTTYYWYVQADCGGADFSAWSNVSTFNTECTSTSIPYSQDFESAVVPDMPICTSVQNAGTGNNWVTENTVDYGFSSNTLKYRWNTTNAANTWFYTQGIELVAGTSYRLSFKYGGAGFTESLKVAYGTSAANGSMTNLIIDYPNVTGSTPSNSSTDFVPSVTGTYYIGFNCYSIADQLNLYVDDILLEETPTCLAPTALTSSAITTSSATISWAASASAPANGYEYYVATTATPVPDAATTATGTTAAGVTTANLSSLSANTTYYFWVRSNCDGTDFSAWAGPATFATACGDVTVFPFTEDFDGNWTTWCWEVIDNDTDGNTWNQNDNYITAHSGTWTAEGMGNDDDYLITPHFVLANNYTMSWWDIVENMSYNNTYDVLVSTTDKNIASFTNNLGTFNCTNTTWTQHTLDLSAYNGQNIYIAFHQTYSAATYYGFGIDDFSIFEATPPAINQIDLYSQAQNISVCEGTTEGDAIANLASSITITNTNNAEFIVPLTWAIVSYDANTPAIYNATGTFTLPAGVVQSDPVTVLAVNATVTVNAATVPTFSFATSYCLGATADALPLTSGNGITGTWNIATISTATASTTDYIFSPTTGVCAVPVTIPVTVNALPVVTCPTDFTVTTTAVVTLTGGLPAGGVYSGTGVTAGDFDPSALANADYTITYTYNDGMCENFCDFVATVNISYPELNVIDLYSDVADINVCAGTTEAAAIADLATEITITNTDDDEFIVPITWTIASYDANTPAVYDATGTFTLPAGVSQTTPIATLLEVTATVTVDAATVPTFSFATSYCVGTTADALPLTSGNGVTGTWNIATISTATASTTDYIFTPTTGVCAVPVTISVTVNPIVTPTFDFATSYCLGATADALPLTSGNGITGTWNIAPISTVSAGSTDYTFTTDAGQCAVASVVIAVTVSNITTPTFSFDTEYCLGATADALPLTSGNGITGTWNIATISTATASTTDYTFTPTTGVCADPVTISVTVNALPVVTCPTDFTVIVEDVVTLSGAMPAGGTYSGTGVTGDNFDPSALTNGSYTITYTYDDATTTCSNFCEFIITVNIPFPAIAEIDVTNAVADVAVCLGTVENDAIVLLADVITITDTEDNQFTVSLNWTIDAYDANTPADYTATGTFELPAGVSQTDPVTVLEVTATVTVNALPVVTCPETMNVAVNTPVAFTGQTPAGGTFSGTGVVSDTFDPNGLDNGTYVITYTYTDPTTGCDNSCDFDVIVDVDISVEGVTVESVGIYPNPNNGMFNLDFSNINGQVNYQVYDTKGSIIVQREIPTNGNTVEEVSVDLTPGVYYVKIVTTNQTFVEKLVIE